jgi:tripartite-type tricarboxylate transporter receptor subunit TctC
MFDGRTNGHDRGRKNRRTGFMFRRSLIGTAAAAALLPAVARAQSFPSKQLRLIVGFAAGGGGDIVARVLAAELTKSDGYSVLVDNKPGAGGNIATREALRAPPDGHAVLFANVGMLAVNPYAMKDVGYDPTTDIAPVCLAVDFSNVLVVHPSVPAKTLTEYLALAKRPEGMDYGSSGVGGAGHLAGELLKARSGAKLNHIPFRGGGPAMNDLVAGHVPSLIASAPTATPLMREGRIRALAVTGAKRSPFDPDIPTIAEQGFPGYAATNWYAVVVSSKVPPETVAALNAILTKALKAPEVQAAYAQQGMETIASTQAEAAAHIARETEIWKKVIADAGIRLE